MKRCVSLASRCNATTNEPAKVTNKKQPPSNYYRLEALFSMQNNKQGFVRRQDGAKEEDGKVYMSLALVQRAASDFLRKNPEFAVDKEGKQIFTKENIELLGKARELQDIVYTALLQCRKSLYEDMKPAEKAKYFDPTQDKGAAVGIALDAVRNVFTNIVFNEGSADRDAAGEKMRLALLAGKKRALAEATATDVEAELLNGAPQ
jgi:hypothetical protein